MKSPREALQPEVVPPPPPPKQPRKRVSLVSLLSGVLSFVIVLVVVGIVGWSFAERRVAAPGPLSADKTVNIARGEDVAETLEEQGVIDSAQFLKLTLLLERNKDKVKWGEYLFKQNASLQEVIDTLVSGKQVLHSLTIPEGLTSLQAMDRLRENDILVGDVKTIPPEGSLMPDTYKFSRGTTREQVIKTMQQEARKVVAEVWAHHQPDSAIRSPSEMVTLASIVEKETGKADERPHVASVFLNRLARNMPLQSDPTIVYGLVGGKGTLGRGILKSEVEQKTPYNTYTISGLPPGPIANPGRAALEAVANPSRTKDLYFVADGTGGHAFAETLDQHKANVLKWRQVEKDAKDKLVPDADKAGQTAPPGAGKPDQRGDASDSPSMFGSIGGFAAAAPSDPQSKPAPSTFAMRLPPTDAALAFAAGSDNPLASGNFKEVDLGLPDDDQPAPAGSSAIDGPDDGGSGSMLTFPVSAARQAEMRARAAAYGLPAASAAPGGEVAAAQEVADSARPAQSLNGQLPNGRVAIYDASEGTALDPLKNTNYDLNSAKTVPTLKALPPMVSNQAR